MDEKDLESGRYPFRYLFAPSASSKEGYETSDTPNDDLKPDSEAIDHELTKKETSASSPDRENNHGVRSIKSANQNTLQPVKTNASSIAEEMSALHEFMFVATICSVQFTTQVGLGQMLAILPIVGMSFGLTNPAGWTWLIAGYSLTVGTFILAAGRFGDVFGYKRMLIIGYAWFSLWTMIAGTAYYSNHVLFTFARVFQGIGPAILMPNGLAILGATYAPGRRKNMVFAMFGAMAPGGSIVGSLFAGLFALTFWPWAFWAFSIALACITVVAVFVIPDPPSKLRNARNYSVRDRIRQLDVLGGAVGVTALVLFNFAWNQAPIVGWGKAYVIVTLILGVVLVPAFFYIEMRVSKNPLIPFDALTTDVVYVLGCISCGWGCFGIWVYYIWAIFLHIKMLTPLQATAWLSPVAISGACASVVTGLLLTKIGPAWVMLLALTFFCTGTILTTFQPVTQTYWSQAFVTMLITPWGMDMSFPAATVILSNSVSKEHQGIAASLVATIVNYSISLALGFAGTIEVNINPGSMEQGELLKGYHAALYFAIGLAGVGICISLIYLLKTEILGRKKK